MPNVPFDDLVPVLEDTAQFAAWDKHHRATRDHSAPTDDIIVNGRRCRGWRFYAEWPPGHVNDKRKAA
jgi:hypothetical protein